MLAGERRPETVTVMPSPLMNALRDPDLYPHPVSTFRVLETHISEVLLTGVKAYKIKKPVNFGFLDFTTLEERKRCCEAEVRLNRRLSGDLYEGVTAIGGTPGHPVLDGGGEPFEYAVRMREFSQDCLLDAVARRGELRAEHLDALARRLADFHADTPPAPPGHDQRRPEALIAPMRQNFRVIRPLLTDAGDLQRLDRLQDRLEREAERLTPELSGRIARDCVRECHGDLHLGNMALLDGQVIPFDGIEFNDAFRVIDVASDIAFLVMDLESRDQPALANRVLNGWLEAGGDYSALAVIGFYKTYRALVRAKVSLLRLDQQPDEAGRRTVLAEYRRYAALAEGYGAARPVWLALTRGVSAVGKSRVALRLVEAEGAIRLRSDVERKRMLGEPAAVPTGETGAGLYSAEATRLTYARLAELAGQVLAAGYPVVADATFLKREPRAALRALARTAAVPFMILDCTAPDAVLLARLAQRRAEGGDPSDADEAVIRAQQAGQERLDDDERAMALTVDTAAPDALALLPERLRARLCAGPA